MPLGIALGTQLGHGGARSPISFLAVGNSLAAQDRNGAVTLTGSGALRYAPGNGGRINLAPNPAVNTTNFYGVANGASLSRITSDFVVGSGCLQVVTPGAVSNEGTNISTGISGQLGYAIGDGQTWTASAYVKAPAGATMTLLLEPRLISGAGAGSFSQTNFTATGSWQRVSVTRTMNANTGASRICLWVRTNGAQAITFLVDGVLIEQSSSPGSYFDGSSDGCAWADPITGIAGTAHNCPSISRAAFWVEEATTNLFRNPSAEVNTTDASGRSSATVTRDTTYAYVGSASYKCVTPGSIVNEGFQLQTSGALGLTGAANPYTGHCRVRGSGSVGVLIQAIYTDTTSTNGTATNVTLTDAWQYVNPASITIDSAKIVDYFRIVVWTITSAQATTFYVDACQIEQKAYATSYCDGALGGGYSWSGTAHLSTSSRTGASITVTGTTAQISTLSGAAVARSYIPYEISSGNQYILNHGTYGGATDDFLGLLHRYETGDKHRMWARSNGTDGTADSVASVNANEWKLLVGDWNGTTVRLSVDAGAFVSATRGTPTGTPNISTTLNIGNGSNGTQQVNGYIGPVAIYDRPLTIAEISTLNNSEPSGWWSAI